MASSRPLLRPQFWERPLAELNEAEWEALCDGCGLCCLHKLQDDETEQVFFTDVACDFLDLHTCRCTGYQQRQQQVADCLSIREQSQTEGGDIVFEYLPLTCAYRLRHQQQPLPVWHPLLTHQPLKSAAVMGQQGVIHERMLTQDLHDRIIDWVQI